MKRMLFAVMAVVMAVAFSAPAFADEGKKGEEKKKGGGHVVINADDKGKDKKDSEKKPK
jgi:hypothetical protein